MEIVEAFVYVYASSLLFVLNFALMYFSVVVSEIQAEEYKAYIDEGLLVESVYRERLERSKSVRVFYQQR